MKRLLIVVVGIVLLGGGYWWMSRRQPAIAATPVGVTPSVSPDAAQNAKREAWFGSAALGPGVRWRDSGLGYHIIAPGDGAHPGIGEAVRITYVGRLKDGRVFDRTEKPVAFRIGRTIPGLSSGLQMLGQGGQAVFFIPPSLGYGGQQVMGIPANSGLIFEVRVVSIGDGD